MTERAHTHTHTHTEKQYVGEHNILNTKKKKKSPIVSQFALSSRKDFFFLSTQSNNSRIPWNSLPLNGNSEVMDVK